MSLISEKRLAKFKRVAALRQKITVVLENVHDPHNIGAVMRTCDAVGIDEIYVLYSDEKLDFDRLDALGTSSTGVKKWIQIHKFRDIEACFQAVSEKYDQVLATHLAKDAVSMYQCDLSGDVAFLFGNEHEGLTEEALSYATGNILIPQMGMAQSLNISVACAVTIYECLRQRLVKDMYAEELSQEDAWRNSVYKRFCDIQEASYKKK